ncbi:MAG: hypothetical protein IK001_08235 [Lachnospiraceae bacterium]|nr:hypothetical protein [Lachnospiraceae bacterium]
MRNRHSKTDFVIDLTSLLDVIFIVLLIVMCGQKLLSDDTKEAAAKAEEMIEAADASMRESDALQEYYRQHTEAFENTEQYVRFVDVVAYFDSSTRISDRTVIVTAGMDEGTELVKIPVTAANEKEGYEALQKYLTGIINEVNNGGAPVPVILSLNRGDDSILYRDETAISNIFEYLASQYDNVFTR